MKKLLVANRSEIAIRVFRAATELGLATVAIYSYEDRYSLHRFKADESYQIGGPDAPVKNYLNIGAIVETARRHGVDAIHPGYGFLAENPAFAAACAEAGITFIGPPPKILSALGDKTAARRIARQAGAPILPGTEHGLTDAADIRRRAHEIGFPLMIKASFGGGGRGMRVVASAAELTGRLQEAEREAASAFGRPEVFLERYIPRAKHIEVQILGDQHGQLVHLFERDCSVQRRHQKVVEIAPCLGLDPRLRQKMCATALAIGRQVGYQNAGTVEFLLDTSTGEFFFIEVNPRIQVEHTVTEIVTGIDLVKAQILIAQGHRLHEAPLHIPPQEQISVRHVALQCRITTEDPANHFVPDYGRLSTYRSPAGFGVRLDGGTAYAGAVITPYFDSLLVKLTCYAPNLQETAARVLRALAEFRVRGVKTNIPFLENLVRHPTFLSGQATTTFIDDTPALFRFAARRDRATKLLSFLGDLMVNGSPDVKKPPDLSSMTAPAPIPYAAASPPPGLRDRLKAMGPRAFAQWVRGQKPLFFTDTTMRDAHQSLLATRMRTADMLAAAAPIAHLLPNLFSLEMWGGATFDSALRFLHEDPWDRLDRLRGKIPNIPFQMLLRASNAVGYRNYPDNVVRFFVRTAAAHGIDIFRVFDSLNWTRNMRVAMDAVLESGAVLEAAICYTGDLLEARRPKYGLSYYVKMAVELEKAGAHILAIKDMAGLCKPFAAGRLVRALREHVGLPIHFHTHDTAGVQAASILFAAEAGVDIADAAISSLSGLTSQPNLNSLVAALAGTARATGLDPKALAHLADYWEAVRRFYQPFEEGMLAGTASVYEHEMPGGQYTNLRVQARSLGLAERWNEITAMYARVNQLFGDIVKVTPSSKVVGDMALFLIGNNLKPEDVLDTARHLDFPTSVVEMLHGDLGQPPGGWPKKLQQIILKGRKPLSGRPGANLKPANLPALRRQLAEKMHTAPTDADLASYLMYPEVFLKFVQFRRDYDDVSVLPTPIFFYPMRPYTEVPIELEEGKTLLIKFLTIGDPDAEGNRTVFFEVNGQPREVKVADRALSGKARPALPKAQSDNPAHIAAPMPGKISALAVSLGQSIARGDRLLSIEAMKMETAVYSPRDGRIAKIHIHPGLTVAAGDLLLEFE